MNKKHLLKETGTKSIISQALKTQLLFLGFTVCFIGCSNWFGPLVSIKGSSFREPPSGRVVATHYGMASFYGPGFHGRKTANGETFHQLDYTAAHKRLPFGTVLRVTNLDNGKSVRVRINDRGPYIKGREIDLSLGVAKKLGFLQDGVTRVKLEQLKSS